jgi:hypothetical protein
MANEDDTTTQWSDDDYALTTTDNPFSPFTQFVQWYAFDTTKGYHSSALLARLARSSDDLSDADQHAAIQSAIDEIVTENISGMHKKVLRENFPSVSDGMGGGS